MSGKNQELEDLKRERAEWREAAILRLSKLGVEVEGRATAQVIAKAIKQLTGKDSDAYDLIRGLLSGRYRPRAIGTAPNAKPTTARLMTETGRPLRWSPPMRYVAARAQAAEPVLRSLASSVARTRVWEV